MSDGLVLGLATIISTSVITPVVAYLIRRSERKITDKVDVYHAAVNGNMEKLLKTTEELAKIQGADEERKNPTTQ